TLVVKKDESFDPSDVGFLRHVTVMASADRLADLIEEFWFRWRCRWTDCCVALEAISVQQVYFGAFHVVSSRSQRRVGFNCGATDKSALEVSFLLKLLSVVKGLSEREPRGEERD